MALGLATATTVTAGVAAAVSWVALGSAATGVSVAALARAVADAVDVGWIVVAEALAGVGEALGVSVAAAVGWVVSVGLGVVVAGTKVTVGRGLLVAGTLMEAIRVGRATVAIGAVVAVGGTLVAEGGTSVGGCVSVAGI